MKKIISAVMAASMAMGAFCSVPVTASAKSSEMNIIRSESWTDTLGIARCSIAEERTVGGESGESCCEYIEDGITFTAEAYDTGEVFLTLSFTEDTVMNSEHGYIRFARDNFSYPAYLYDAGIMTSDYSHLFLGADSNSYGVNIFYNDFFNSVHTQSQAMKKLRDNGGIVPDTFTTGYCCGSGEYQIVPENGNDGLDIHYDAGSVLCTVVFRPIRDLHEWDVSKPIAFDFFGNGDFSFYGSEVGTCHIAESDNASLWYRDSTPINDFDFVTEKTYRNGDISLTFTNNDTSRDMQSIISVNNYDPLATAPTELVHNSYVLSDIGGSGLSTYSSVQSHFGSICETGEGVPATYFVNEHNSIGTYGYLNYRRTNFSAPIFSGYSFFNTIEGYAMSDRIPYTMGDTAYYVTEAEHMALLNFKSTDTGFGDTNLDGQVDLSDAVFIMQALSNPDKYQITDAGRVLADVCDIGNGITSSDALNIQKYLLGLLDSPVTL